MVLDDMADKKIPYAEKLKYHEKFVEAFAQRLYEYEKTKQ
jgi:hypothetical protein